MQTSVQLAPLVLDPAPLTEHLGALVATHARSLATDLCRDETVKLSNGDGLNPSASASPSPVTKAGIEKEDRLPNAENPKTALRSTPRVLPELRDTGLETAVACHNH